VTVRREELLEGCYQYVLEHGLSGLSLRPLAQAVGSSPRVLLYLFGSKDGLVRELLARARRYELEALEDVHGDGLEAVTATLWEWLSAPQHRRLLILWVDAYARSLVAPHGPWAGFARQTVEDWQDVAERTRTIALLRGGLLDLLATGDERRVGAAVAGRGLWDPTFSWDP
jgi:AcrR family transcriptional regulator